MSHTSSPSLKTKNENLNSFPNTSPESLKIVPLKITQKSTTLNRHGDPLGHTKHPYLKCGLKT